MGEETAPATYCYNGALDENMEGVGCSRIDLMFVNQVAAAPLQGYEQLYAQGIYKHALLSANIHIPALGAIVDLPR